MITALIIGFITGWLISMPVGPVSAAVITRTLKFGARNGILVSVGAAIMDFLYCGGAAQIHEFLSSSPLINLIFQIIGLIVLMFIGIKTLTAKTAPRQDVTQSDIDSEREAEATVKRINLKPGSVFGPLFLGVILYASNVAAVPEWIFISALWRQYGLLEEGVAINLIFAVGAGLGTLGWGYFLVKFIERRRRGFKESFLAKINTVAGGALLLFALYFGYQIIFNTDWQAVGMSWKLHVG